MNINVYHTIFRFELISEWNYTCIYLLNYESRVRITDHPTLVLLLYNSKLNCQTVTEQMACTSPTQIANGHVSYDSLANGPTWANGEVVKYKCFKYYGLVNTDLLTCSGGSWTGTTPRCEYHQKTEIVFWFVIAVVILLLLLLLALIIFLCCYFCRCCKRPTSRNRKSSGSSDNKHKDKYSEKNERGNGCCKPCCSSEKENSPDKRRGNSESRDSRTGRPHSQERSKKEKWSCCGTCCNKGKALKSPNGSQQTSPGTKEHNDKKKDNGTSSKSGCCSCCRSKPKQQATDEHNRRYHETNDSKPKESDSERKPFRKYDQPTKESRTNQPVSQSTSAVYTGYIESPENEHERRQREIERLQQEEKEREEREKIEQNKREKEQEQQREQELKRLEDERERKRREEEKIRKEKEDKLKKERAEQQQKYEDEMKKQREIAEKEREKEFQIQRQREEARQKEQEKEDRLKREIEEKEKENAEQQRKYEEELKKQREMAERDREKELMVQRQRELDRQKQQEKEDILKRELGEREKENAEQQRKYEEELKKQREMAEREREKELMAQRQRELNRQKELKRVEERKRKFEEEKKREKEKQRLQQQELARQLSEQNKMIEQEKKQQANYPAYSTSREDFFGANEYKDVKSARKYRDSDNKKTDIDTPRRERQKKLINSNDKYIKGLIDDDIGKKGTRNPQVYNPLKLQKPTKVSAMDGSESDRSRYTKDDVLHDDHHDRKRPLKLINSNDKYMRGINSDSIGKKATNNPFVYRPYKIEKPTFNTSD